MIQNYMDVLKRYALFTGRSSRREYWLYTLVNVVIYIVLDILLNVTHSNMIVVVITVVFALALILPTLAVGFRRLHDTNRTAWWILIALIPIVGSIILIVFLTLDSTPGDNKYGPNPKGVSASAASMPASMAPTEPKPEPPDLNPQPASADVPPTPTV